MREREIKRKEVREGGRGEGEGEREREREEKGERYSVADTDESSFISLTVFVPTTTHS